jgi:hypothetical protein
VDGGGSDVGVAALLLMPGAEPRPMSESCAERERVRTESGELCVRFCCWGAVAEAPSPAAAAAAAAASLLPGLVAAPGSE